MSKAVDVWKYGEYLDRIASYIEVRQGLRPRKKELPRMVIDTYGVVEQIERLVVRPDENLERKELPRRIQTVLTNRDVLRTLVSNIDRELGRSLGRPVNAKPAVDGIFSEITAMINSLASIQNRFHYEGHEKIPFAQLNQHICETLDEYNEEFTSCKEILKQISREIDPMASETSTFEDLPSKVALRLSGNQSSGWNDARQTRMANYQEMGTHPENSSNSENEEKLRWYINRVDELERTVQGYRQREEHMKLLDQQNKNMLADAYREAGHLRATIDAKKIEIDKMRATEVELREGQASVSEALRKVRLQHQTTLKAMQVEIQELKDKNSGAISRAETEKRSAMAEVERRHAAQIQNLTARHAGELNNQKTSVEQHYRAELNTQKKGHDADKKSMESRHQSEKEKLKSVHADALRVQVELTKTLQAGLDEEVNQHTQSKARFRKRVKEHEDQRIVLESQHTQKLAQQGEVHLKALERVEGDKVKQLDEAREEHKRQMMESKNGWELKLAQTVSDHEDEQLRWEQTRSQEQARNIMKVEELIQSHTRDIEALETEVRLEKANTAKKVHEEAQKLKGTIEKLEKQYQNLHGILLKQDEYKGLRDLEIVRGVSSKTGKVSIIGFAGMVSKVTTFSEWEWREDREIWPKEIMTALVGTKQRRLKKLILGDVIWMTLFQLIFCSPFKILGKEGDRLEADWNKSFPSDDIEAGNEYKWPTATAVSEKYRWETCEAALDSLTTKSSPYGALRSSFAGHQSQFQDRFLETVEAYVNITEKREQDLLEFLAEAVRMWIVFCTQRYRLRVILPGSHELDPEKKAKLAQEQNDLKFTVMPELQRHGNAKGLQLEEVSVVSGCEGSVATAHES